MKEEYVIYKKVDGKETEIDTASSILWVASILEMNIKSDHMNGVDAEYRVVRREVSPMG